MSEEQFIRQQWLTLATEDPDISQELQSLLQKNDTDGLHDRFYRTLEFGTGGLRGIIGAGTNRINIYTVRQATQGLANWLKTQPVPQKVAIAYDSRNKSSLFAEQAACVLAANDIEVHLYPRLMPTPALSFAVRHLGCGAGICVTASHNPAAYNGYKVYGKDGCQIGTETADAILEQIQNTSIFEDVQIISKETALQSHKLHYIEEETVDAFIAAVLAQRIHDGSSPLKIVYSPLNGTGLECVTRTLSACGFNDVSVVPEQRDPDGNFPTCPYPNPEIQEAMQLGLNLAKELSADLLLATDPDCDRVGIAVPHQGEYILLTGNEVGVLLLDYICRLRSKQGSLPNSPVAVKTIVTTEMAAAVAHKYEVELRNVLTGFKFIGEQIGMLEQQGHVERYIFGFEESYGYLSGPHVRDKDAVNASLLICDMAAWYKQQGLTLVDALERLYQEFGFYTSTLDSFTFEGEQGFATMQRLMETLRTTPPATINENNITQVIDYAIPQNSLPSSNVLQFRLSDNTLITVRPSGTEPKLKVYCSATRPTAEQTQIAAEGYQMWMRNYIQDNQ